MKKAYQLHSVRDKCTTADDFKNTLRAIAKMGYDGVEFFDYCGIPAEEMKALLDELNIVPVNAHVRWLRWMEDVNGEIDYAKKIGMNNLTFPWPPIDWRGDSEIGKLIENLQLWCEKTRENGINMFYHNHDFDFEQYNGIYAIDRIMDAIPQLNFEMDAFWVEYAGVDPLVYMKKYSNRMPMIHIKDYLDRTAKPEPVFCAIGKGLYNNAPIIAQAKSAGCEWIIVDLDNAPNDTLVCAQESLAHLNTLF